MFAQVLLREPQILMLDEPVSALDMHHQLNLLEEVYTLSLIHICLKRAKWQNH